MSESWIQKDGYLPYRPWVDLDKNVHDPNAWIQKDGYLPYRPWVDLDKNVHDPNAWIQKDGYLPYRPWVPFKEAEMIYPDEDIPVIPPIDWTASMQQTYEYYVVDPSTWANVCRLDEIISSSLTRDDSETLGSANLQTTELLSENYIRTYLIAKQNGYEYRFCLGTFLYMTSSDDYDGIVHTYSMTGYSPLIELKENLPPIGYFIRKDNNILNFAKDLITNNVRAKTSFKNVYDSSVGDSLTSDFVANTDDTWLSFITNLISNVGTNNYKLSINEEGIISFDKYESSDNMSAIWTYSDDNSSILLPSVSMERDLYGIPNVVEVVYSGDGMTLYSRVVNDDPDSPTSTINRKREITQRVTDVNIPGKISQEMLDEYARKALESLSTIKHKLSYSHGYCPVRVGDCVMLDYKRAGLVNIKARVISQQINCTAGCTVSETAVYTEKLWRAD